MLQWIFYQCTYVGVLHKSKYSLIHEYGTFKFLPLYFRGEICLFKQSKYDDHISGIILYQPFSPCAIDGLRFRNLSWVRVRSDIQKKKKKNNWMPIHQTRICQWLFYPNHKLLSVLNYIWLAPLERCNFPSPLLLYLSLPISLLLLADRDCRLPINLVGPVPILDLQAYICWRNKPRTLFPVPIPAPRHILPLSQSVTFKLQIWKRSSPIKIINRSIFSQIDCSWFSNCRWGKARK